jgi:molybdate transport system substrate-binding protein
MHSAPDRGRRDKPGEDDKGIIVPEPKPLKIFSGGAMRPLLRELAPLFAREHGVTVEIEFKLSAVIKGAIQDGAVFDIAILPRPELDELIECGAIVGDSAADLARSIVGLAIRAGAPKPDIGSVEALRQALLRARSIAHSDGPSGAYVAALLTKLGIAEALAEKVKLTSGPVAELVARGEAELGMQQIIAILPIAGAELVGPSHIQGTRGDSGGIDNGILQLRRERHWRA